MNTNIDYWEKVLQNPTPSYKSLFEAEKEYLLTHISKNARVLDVGCGEGRNIQTILGVTENITGIDNDPKAVSDAQKELASVPTIEVLLADVLKMPFESESFDFVTLMMTLVNFEENKVAALTEMARVLKNEGKIIISVYSEDAFDTRIEMYEQIGVPISKTEGTKVIFDESVGANKSEQFSKGEIESLAEKAALKVVDYRKIGNIAIICELMKK